MDLCNGNQGPHFIPIAIFSNDSFVAPGAEIGVLLKCLTNSNGFQVPV